MASTLPQFGSAPKKAAFTRLLPATARARSRAAAKSGAPETSTSRSRVAPSPSWAIARASSRQRLSSAAAKASNDGPGPSIGGLPARPFASAKTESLVLMSPSTVRLSKLVSIAAASAAWSGSGRMAQSVTTTAIIVASCGAIIPEPLAIAEIVTSRPSSAKVRWASFTIVSVVRIASAAGSGSGRSASTRRGSAAVIFPSGRRTPMTPVEAASRESTGAPSARPSASSVSRTSAAPAGPVSALALPLLTTTARIPSAGSRRRASSTGAARASFTVKQPAAAQGPSLTTRARSLRAGLSPACTPAKRKPAGTFTARSSAARTSRPPPAARGRG